MRRAFTLIELIVVIAILAVVSAAVIPRLRGLSKGQADVAIERLSELLSLFAWRDNAGSQQCAIYMNPDSNAIELWTLEPNPARPADPAEWVPDRYVQPVRMPESVELADVLADGMRIGGSEWRIVGSPSGNRPRIEMRVIADGLDTSLVLEPGAAMPIRVDNGRIVEDQRTMRDLDARGMSREPW
ncbi:MAG: type II secretion system GspH family protein [Planctomycetes bacterium]|nr:type II secretion system GspH family protein [Planctomycetota bacterium]